MPQDLKQLAIVFAFCFCLLLLLSVSFLDELLPIWQKWGAGSSRPPTHQLRALPIPTVIPPDVSGLALKGLANPTLRAGHDSPGLLGNINVSLT